MQSRIEQSELLDIDWYLERYPDVRELGMSPAEHYLRIGARLLRDPGPDFSTVFYLADNPDVAKVGVNPLWHYLVHGREEGRRIAPSGSHLASPTPQQPVPLLDAAALPNPPARVISFYLPQFHAIPENDAWWGKGFTEWTNVRPAKSQFIRHYQPHEPGELGYYDLGDTGVQRRQIELAKLYGIAGFCFYFYWFAGKRLLETPIRNYLQDKSLDLPFCLCWANENWSRRWDGREQDVLISQQHSAEDDLAFIEHVSDYMRDARYIRIDGKPLLLVYRPNLLPEPASTVERWRDWCRQHGLGEIYLAYTQSFESNNPEEYGFDAAIEFPPNNSGVPLVTRYHRPHADFQGRIYDWTALVERSYLYPSKPYTLFRGICPSWDNTARRGNNATILAGSNPPQFTRWANNAIRDTRARFVNPDERLVFVNAWNEWAEGAHLEPDLRYGYAWLESVRVALASNAQTSALPIDASIAIVIELSEPARLERVIRLCARLPERHRLFVAAPASVYDEMKCLLDSSGRDHVLEVVANDYAGEPFLLKLLRNGRMEGFDVVVRLGDGVLDTEDEQGSPLELLDAGFLEHATARFAADGGLGMLCPDGERLSAPADVTESVRLLGGRLGLRDDEIVDHAHWSGRGFIARSSALLPLASLAFDLDGFQAGTACHARELPDAIERCMALSPIASGLRVSASNDPNAASDRSRIVIVSHDAHPHGAQLLALNMARQYGQLGFDVDMLVLAPGRLMDRFAEVATVHRVDLGTQQISSTLRLLSALRAAGAEVAIVNTTVSGLVVPLLKRAGFRVVSLIHELPGILNGYGLQEHARAIADHADSVVFPARIVRDGFQSFVGREVVQGAIRPQGLYLRNPHRSDAQRQAMRDRIRSEFGLRPEARIILCAGYADHRKGLDLFAEACIKVMASDPDVIGMWIGHANQAFLAQVEESIREAGYQDRFVFTGLVDNPQDFYSAADVYALTSREDPFPSVVMEALDAHVPVVSFAGVVGSEELLERGTGLLVPAFDTDMMADALSRLLDDAELSARLASTGHEIVEDELSFRHYLFDLQAFAGRPIPKVSVVVPNYNYARYIGERLASIQRQTAPIFELIVLDDASTDDSVDVIREFLAGCGLPSKLVVNDNNSGSVFRQWQRGVEMARGDFVWIAEADDLADPEFLQEVVSAFSDPQLVMSYTQSRQMGSEGQILCEHYLDYVSDIDRERWTQSYKADGREEISKALFIKNTIPNVSAVLFRRQALLDVLVDHQQEIFSYRNAGDWVVYLRLMEKGGLAYCPRPLNSHRRHQGSVTIGSFNLAQLQEIIRVQQDTIRRHKLGMAASKQADAYAQSLYEQFGLATDMHPDFREHPEIKSQANS
jgi:glycosyltransferase involved in cell wall biosynthesis/GT2 family glycosyltransferase